MTIFIIVFLAALFGSILYSQVNKVWRLNRISISFRRRLQRCEPGIVGGVDLVIHTCQG